MHCTSQIMYWCLYSLYLKIKVVKHFGVLKLMYSL